jgi:hypothetical protein
MTHSTFRITVGDNSNRELVFQFAQSIQKITKDVNKPTVITRDATPVNA